MVSLGVLSIGAPVRNQASTMEVFMQTPQLPGTIGTREIVSTDGVHAEMRAMRTTAIGAWPWLGVLVLLFLASIVYAAIGGVLEPSPGSEPETLRFAATTESTGSGGAASEKKALDGSDSSADYFSSAYPNRGRTGEGNVMTYEHD